MRKRLFFWAIILSLFIGDISYAASREEMVVGRLTLDGETISGVRRLEMDSNNKVLLASGTTVPANGTAGYAKGCVFIDTDTATGICGRYENIGTSASCQFRVIGNHVMESNSLTAIATTGTTSVYITVPETSRVSSVSFAGSQGIGTSSTNYINFGIVNLGQAGAGTDQLLHGSCTTKGTDAGGLGTLGTNTTYPLTLSTTVGTLSVTKNDRLRLDAGVTGTLGNTITLPSWILTFAGN